MSSVHIGLYRRSKNGLYLGGLVNNMAHVGHEAMMDIAFRTNLGLAACAVADLGIADLIPRGAERPVAELAAETRCDAGHLYRTLRLLASYGIFMETASQQFALTPTAEAMRADAPESTGAGWRTFSRLTTATARGLAEGLRTAGTPTAIGLGQTLFEFLGAHPEDAVIFDAGMTAIHGPETAAMLDAYDFGGIGTLADVGGGNGSLLMTVLRKYSALRGLLFDLEHVIGRATSNVQSAGLSERCRIERGNFFQSIPSGADAYLFRHIIHDWTDEQSTTILKNCRKVVPATGRLLLVEVVVPEGNDRSRSKDFDLAMLFYSGGRERTEQEYRQLFAGAGFLLHGITPTSSPVSVIEARPV